MSSLGKLTCQKKGDFIVMIWKERLPITICVIARGHVQ